MPKRKAKRCSTAKSKTKANYSKYRPSTTGRVKVTNPTETKQIKRKIYTTGYNRLIRQNMDYANIGGRMVRVRDVSGKETHFVAKTLK